MSDSTSVQVALRIRPLVPSEISKGSEDLLEVFSDMNQVRIKGSDKAFSFNYVFASTVKQDFFYTTCVQNQIENLFKGFNVTILAYGQTGSGKTHSMGTAYCGEGDMGVIPRAINDIFNFVKDNFSYDFTLTVSFMELYQEILYDLLANKPRDQCCLEIREDNKSIFIPGLTERPVTSAAEALHCLHVGSLGRATSATNMNAQSSRSHAIFTINICMQKKGNSNLNKTAKFHLVDLAGSERSKKTGATGQTFKEGVNINKGLLALGNVISALGDEKTQNGYISYRDSNLTRLLKDSLGGNSFTLMIACVSPADYNLEETLSTLRYADRAKKIKNKPVINQDPKTAEINRLNRLVQQLRLELVGQGGPIMCQAELELLKKEVSDIKIKNRELNIKLSTCVTDNTALLERILLMQTANEELVKKCRELQDEYDITINNLNISNEKNDFVAVNSDDLDRLKKIQVTIANINSEQLKNNDEIRKHEALSIRSTRADDSNSECEINDRQETHNTEQMALTNQLQEVTHMLMMKEHLVEQIAANTCYAVDYSAMAECKSKIESLESEKENLLQQLKNVHSNGPSNKIAEQRRKRLQELESQIHDLHKKVTEQARLIKMKEKDEVKIKQLNNEITGMKQTKVKLIKKMREESDKFRVWKLQREKELHKLKDQDRKRQNQIVRMETVHSQQQKVWKRKVEEAAATNKRLKDALERRKAVQNMKSQGKIERVGHWIKQELEIYVNIMDGKMSLTGLMDDRANLHKQLEMLKTDSGNVDSAEIEQLEDDIQLRTVQIQDLQQKLLDFDDDKGNLKWDNIQTMVEAKYALKTLFELVADIKRNCFLSENRIQELENSLEDLHKQKESHVTLLKEKDIEHSNNLREYEDKISLLLHRLKPSDIDCDDDRINKILILHQEKLEHLEEENEKLRKENQELKCVENACSSQLLTPPKIKEKVAKKRQTKHAAVKMEHILEDDKLFYESDDQEKDPDWRNTPLGKRIQGIRNTTLQPAPAGQKRSSDGGCTCNGNCSTRNCVCKKTSKFCNESCKCSKEGCRNRRTDQENSNVSDESNNEDHFKKPTLPAQEDKDLCGPSAIQKKTRRLFSEKF